ncbi:MAG: hypothetical protein ISP71_08880 [Flavobacteriales bacterium]|nr:hypothetical protein [Flavobacteriales bacterium]
MKVVRLKSYIFDIMRLCIFFFSHFVYGYNNEDEISIDPSIGIIINDLSYTRIGISTKNLILNKVGLYYTLEKNDLNNRDLLGINVRVINNLYFNFGYHFFTNDNIFEGNRKEIGITYSFKNIPFLIHYGYSSSIGSTINVGYRIFIKQKALSW